jgi:amino-acid N-acetyltransferase
VAGLERYGTSALLRSVAVSATQRGRKVAQRLVDRLLEEARGDQIFDVYLRTTTAQDYFPKFGFAPVDVAEVPAAVRESVEFKGACPASAVTMACCLGPEKAA